MVQKRCQFKPERISAVLPHLASAGEDDETNLSITKHRKLMSLLQKPSSSLREGDLPGGRILNPLDCYLSAPHNNPNALIFFYNLLNKTTQIKGRNAILV